MLAEQFGLASGIHESRVDVPFLGTIDFIDGYGLRKAPFANMLRLHIRSMALDRR
jgi:hypothetical protein